MQSSRPNCGPDHPPTPGDPRSWVHSPLSPWEERFVSGAGLWCIVFVGGASTGGLLVAVGQTEGPGPATDQGRVTRLPAQRRLCLGRARAPPPPWWQHSPLPLTQRRPNPESSGGPGPLGHPSAPSPGQNRRGLAP